jgi:hypothetical protein
VYYEFLDNSVAQGDKPRTIAFGVNGELNILDFKCMFDIERYTKINIDAHAPADVYPPSDQMDYALNAGFLVKCARQIPRINFVDRACGQIYACMESGKMSWIDPDMIKRVLDDEAAMAAFSAMLPKFVESRGEFKQQPAVTLSDEARLHTMGCLR